MPSLTIEVASIEEQTAFNLKRWAEIIEDPEWERWQGRIETDRHGCVLMSPPPGMFHANAESVIARLLDTLLPEGTALQECPISTAQGVRIADVAWLPHALRQETKNLPCLPAAPPICVEVVSPGNSRGEMAEKKAGYFAAGAAEVWFCDSGGEMTFFNSSKDPGSRRSHLCSAFPSQIEV